MVTWQRCQRHRRKVSECKNEQPRADSLHQPDRQGPHHTSRRSRRDGQDYPALRAGQQTPHQRHNHRNPATQRCRCDGCWKAKSPISQTAKPSSAETPPSGCYPQNPERDRATTESTTGLQQQHARLADSAHRSLMAASAWQSRPLRRAAKRRRRRCDRGSQPVPTASGSRLRASPSGCDRGNTQARRQGTGTPPPRLSAAGSRSRASSVQYAELPRHRRPSLRSGTLAGRLALLVSVGLPRAPPVRLRRTHRACPAARRRTGKAARLSGLSRGSRPLRGRACRRRCAAPLRAPLATSPRAAPIEKQTTATAATRATAAPSPADHPAPVAVRVARRSRPLRAAGAVTRGRRSGINRLPPASLETARCPAMIPGRGWSEARTDNRQSSGAMRRPNPHGRGNPQRGVRGVHR